MAKDAVSGINRFLSHFAKVLLDIRELKSSERVELYREVLYVAVLDALSKSVMPLRERNQDRFIEFLKRFCHWPDGERVSLPHVYALVMLNPDPAFEKLRLWAVERYKKMGSGGLPAISTDPKYEEVKALWPVSAEHRTPLRGVDLDALTHYRLLWAYRNSLVHELRRLGRGMDFKDDDGPYYHGMSDLDENSRITETTIELVYPCKFLDRLCETGLGALKRYFTENGINPYESFVFGTYWIRELNR
jgi:hypothetical protein